MVTTPAPASAAGFTNLVFQDDFLTNTVDATAGSSTAGFNWYTYQTQTSGTHFQVLTGSTAASISNGNTSGGSFASSDGGIFKLMGHPSLTNNMQFFSVPTSRWSTSATPGTYQHGYIEAYVQYNASGSSSGGWPAWWAYSTQSEATNGSTGTEIDFLEIDSGGAYGGTVHNNSGGAASGTPIYRQTASSEWHAYGLLWKTTGAGTGQISMFIDNVQVGSTINTGTGSNVPLLESNWLFLVLGTGVGWPMHVDWVRVWQAPPPTTTWDPSVLPSGMALSNSNLTATSSGTNSVAVRSTVSKATGKFYWEITYNTVKANISSGIGNASESNTPPAGLGADTNAMAYYGVTPVGAIYYNGTVVSSGQTTQCANGDVIGWAVDFTNKLFWISSTAMRSNGFAWNNSTTANPATGVGGISFARTGITTGPWYAIFNDETGGAIATINFGPSGFAQSVPMGFSSWDASMAVSTRGPFVLLIG